MSVSSARERIAMVRYDMLVIESEEAWSLEAAQATVFVVDIINN